MIGVIVMTHGMFGQELLRTAQDMVGHQEQVASLSVTPEMGPGNLAAALEQTLDRMHSPEGTIILVDMMGGTPCNAALLKTRDRGAEIVTGINLYMLLSSFTHRGRLDLKSLATRVMEDGRKAILLPKDLLAKKLG